LINKPGLVTSQIEQELQALGHTVLCKKYELPE